MFQDRLQKLREQHGYSVKEAAAALHLPYTTYNNYEKNTREPNGEILCRIAAFFSVSLDYLLGATSTHSNQTVSPEEQAATALMYHRPCNLVCINHAKSTLCK